MQVGVEGKISYAGSALEQKTEWGLSSKRKLPAKESAYPSLFFMLMESAKNPVVFHGLVTNPLLQRKIQKLEKQSRPFEPFEVYRAGSNNQLIPADDISILDTSVISYNSKGPVKKLNYQAKNRTDGRPIACRHLAYAFATGGFGLKMNVNQNEPKEPGGKFNTVASIDNIQNNAAIKTDQQLTKTPVWYGIPRKAVYFDTEHFGQALYDVWMNKGDQVSQGKPSQTWLLSTGCHAMAIKLVLTNGSAIKIELYDPTYTTIVRRVIVANGEILQLLTLNHFISRFDQRRNAMDQGRAGTLKSTDTVEAANDSDVTVLAALTPSLLYLLMRHGQLNNSSMDLLKTTLSEVRSDNLHKLIELLAAKRGDGTPGLFVALQNGHHEAISAYFEVIKQLRDTIEPGVIWELLAAKDKIGTSGLHMALEHGHPQAIRAYVEGIKQFGAIIEPGGLKELLAAKDEFGNSGLVMALQNGDQEVISAYVECINQFRDIIGPEAIKELLAPLGQL